MNYKKLGNTDIDVSTICLGTMTWGEQNTQDEGFKQMDYALDKGVNFWDTAEIYSIPPRKETFGNTEKIIGNWFEKTKKRDKVILASKVCGPMREYVRGGGNQFGEKNINEALDGSLKRLKTDYIDLYQLHWPERNTNFFGKLGYEHSDDGEWTKFEDVLGSLKKFIDQVSSDESDPVLASQVNSVLITPVKRDASILFKLLVILFWLASFAVPIYLIFTLDLAWYEL